MENQSLFRREVLVEQQTQWLGTILLAPRLSHRLFTVFAFVVTAIILSLLFFATYTRKARIGGWLVPEQGLVRVFAPQPGVVTALYVQEGATVRKGERLLALSAELQSAALGATQSEIARRLLARRDSLAAQRQQQQQLTQQQSRSLSARLVALQAEQDQLEREIVTQRTRLRLAGKSEERHQELLQRGFVSDQRAQEAQEDRLDQDLRLRALERSQMTMQRDRLLIESELRDLPLKSQAELASIERSIAAVEQELAETEARREIVIPAPEEGTVTTIQAEQGSRANSNVPLLSIVPAGAKLEANLFSPSRAVGFLQPGQRVLMRYQAYPYQKFGHYEGVLANVSRSAINPGELPAQLIGLTSVVGANEPVYRITVSLDKQEVMAYGQAMPLQPGMQLDADVVIETRKLIEWILDPLFALTGKWHR
jgi:membrane fusion protein